MLVPMCLTALSPPTVPDGMRDGVGKWPDLRFSEVTSNVYRNGNPEPMFCYLSCIAVPTLLFQNKQMSVLEFKLDIAVQYHSIRTRGDFRNPEWKRYCILPLG